MVMYSIPIRKLLLVISYSMDVEACKAKLGERIAELRKAQGLSQDKLRLMIGVGHTYLVDVEKGRRNIGFGNLCKIAAGLGITVSELLDIEELE